ncbi:unnamed protein product [Choristocarpus tenellus]
MQSVSTMDLSAKSWKIMVISDLDKKSKVDDSGKSFKSILLEGDLSRVEAGLDGAFKIEWGTERELHSGHNEAGRGMELSELVMFHGQLNAVRSNSIRCSLFRMPSTSYSATVFLSKKAGIRSTENTNVATPTRRRSWG